MARCLVSERLFSTRRCLSHDWILLERACTLSCAYLLESLRVEFTVVFLEIEVEMRLMEAMKLGSEARK